MIDSTCNENRIRVLKFSQPHGPIFHYEEATNVTFGDQPHLKDPLDKKYVFVKNSTIPNAGHGIFAARDIPASINFVLYGGFLYNKEQSEMRDQEIDKRIRENGIKLDDPMWFTEMQNDADLFKSLNDAPFFE